MILRLQTSCFSSLHLYGKTFRQITKSLSRYILLCRSHQWKKVPCDGNPALISASDPDNNETIKTGPCNLFKPSEIRSTIQPITFTGNKEYWKQNLLTQHSNEPKQVFGKTINHHFFHDRVINSDYQELSNLLDKINANGNNGSHFHFYYVITGHWFEDKVFDTLGWPYHGLTEVAFNMQRVNFHILQ